MKTILSFLAAIVSFTVSAQTVNIPDVNFKAYLVGNSQINKNNDNEIQVSEASSFTGKIDCSNKSIFNLAGIESFTNIYALDFSTNLVTVLDLTKNIKLKELKCDNNRLTNLDISKNTLLEYFTCGFNSLTNLDISKNISLKFFHFPFNQITNIDLSKNIALTDLDCISNSLEYIDISKNINLYIFVCGLNKLETLDTSKNLALLTLYCGANKLKNLDLSKNLSLLNLNFANNQITNLDISKNQNLKTLDCSDNLLTNLDVSKNIELNSLSCNNNLLTGLDISKQTKLTELFCRANELVNLNVKNGQNAKIITFDSTDNPSLTCIQVDNPSYSNSNWPNKDSWANYNTDCSLGINDFKKASMQLYPNPAKEKFIITTNDKIENVEIYSHTGQLLKTAKSKEVNISNLSKGNYLIKIKTDRETMTQKIIKE